MILEKFFMGLALAVFMSEDLGLFEGRKCNIMESLMPVMEREDLISILISCMYELCPYTY